ncbi:MAG TPA: hypothetical protein VK928_06585 [Longimicrobiales bacterium]|nr:hypothetical protein [Longimicrobiales bacterium]
MAGKLSASSQVRLATLKEFDSRVQRVHGLVEMYATSKNNPDQYLQAIGRLFQQLKLQFMGAGLDSMSQLCGSMEQTAKRGLSYGAKSRIMRESVGSLKFQLELEQRAVISEDEAAKRKKAAEDE